MYADHATPRQLARQLSPSVHFGPGIVEFLALSSFGIVEFLNRLLLGSCWFLGGHQEENIVNRQLIREMTEAMRCCLVQ